MAEQRAVIDIAAPVEEVWQVVSNVETWPEWMEEVTSVTTTTPAGGVGAQYDLDQGAAGLGVPLRVRVVTADAPSLFVVEQRSTGITTLATYRVSAVDARITRVESTLASRGTVSAAVGTVLGGSYTRMLESSLDALKRRCERLV